VGRHGRLELTLDVAVDRGGIRLVSTGLSLRIGSRRLPLPPFARVTVDERVNGDGQRVDVCVRSPFIGEIFRYRGSFTYEHVTRDERDRHGDRGRS
jgi:Domain of unknown function (DUF4166)